jgi:hypothetical protein
VLPIHISEVKHMKKTLTALAAALTLVAALAAAPTEAFAQRRAVAAGVVGLAAGAIIGSAIASNPAYAYPRAYYPAPGYVAYPGYAAAVPMGCPGGYWARRPIYDRWGTFVGWSRPRFFCP